MDNQEKIYNLMQSVIDELKASGSDYGSVLLGECLSLLTEANSKYIEYTHHLSCSE